MRWGIVSTIKADAKEILNFAAYHLDLGAEHLFIFLDNDNPRAEEALADHPKITVISTNDDYWAARDKKRPVKHQVRQSSNATYAYRLVGQKLDWLLHIDVDEFLCPPRPVADLLGALADDVVCARVRPAEALAKDGMQGLDPDATYCKTWIPADLGRREIELELYPNFGGFLRHGFVSHFVGKIFVRTGIKNLKFRIHKGMVGDQEIEPRAVLDGTDLCHLHITGWESWQKIIEFRRTRGSYRRNLKSSRSPEAGGMSLHDLLNFLTEDGGTDGLRDFFNEVCLARPDLLKTLEKRGLLRIFHLDVDAKQKRHFPNFRETVAK